MSSGKKTQNSDKKEVKVIKNYQEKYFLGMNNLGQTYRGVNLDNNQECFIKNFSKKQFPAKTQLLKKLEDEVQFLRKQNQSKNIIKLIDVTFTSHNYYVITENCQDWTLPNYLINDHIINELKAGFYLLQIWEGYNYYKSKGVTLRDMSINNILKHEEKIIIDDMGFSKYIDYEVLHASDRIYKLSEAPEAFKGYYNSDKSDVWSLGIIFYYMLYGMAPFKGLNDQELFITAVSQKVFFYDQINGVSQQCKDLIKQMLVVDPKNRISWNFIQKHSFFKELERRLDLQSKQLTVSNVGQLLKLEKGNKQEMLQNYFQEEFDIRSQNISDFENQDIYSQKQQQIFKQNKIQHQTFNLNISSNNVSQLYSQQQFTELRKSVLNSVVKQSVNINNSVRQSKLQFNGNLISKYRDYDSLQQSIQNTESKKSTRQNSGNNSGYFQQKQSGLYNSRYDNNQDEEDQNLQENYSGRSQQSNSNKQQIAQMQFTFQAKNHGENVLLKKNSQNSDQQIDKSLENSFRNMKKHLESKSNSSQKDFNSSTTQENNKSQQSFSYQNGNYEQYENERKKHENNQSNKEDYNQIENNYSDQEFEFELKQTDINSKDEQQEQQQNNQETNLDNTSDLPTPKILQQDLNKQQENYYDKNNKIKDIQTNISQQQNHRKQESFGNIPTPKGVKNNNNNSNVQTQNNLLTDDSAFMGGMPSKKQSFNTLITQQHLNTQENYQQSQNQLQVPNSNRGKDSFLIKNNDYSDNNIDLSISDISQFNPKNKKNDDFTDDEFNQSQSQQFQVKNNIPEQQEIESTKKQNGQQKDEIQIKQQNIYDNESDKFLKNNYKQQKAQEEEINQKYKNNFYNNDSSSFADSKSDLQLKYQDVVKLNNNKQNQNQQQNILSSPPKLGQKKSINAHSFWGNDYEEDLQIQEISSKKPTPNKEINEEDDYADDFDSISDEDQYTNRSKNQMEKEIQKAKKQLKSQESPSVSNDKKQDSEQNSDNKLHFDQTTDFLNNNLKNKNNDDIFVSQIENEQVLQSNALLNTKNLQSQNNENKQPQKSTIKSNNIQNSNQLLYTKDNVSTIKSTNIQEPNELLHTKEIGNQQIVQSKTYNLHSIEEQQKYESPESNKKNNTNKNQNFNSLDKQLFGSKSNNISQSIEYNIDQNKNDDLVNNQIKNNSSQYQNMMKESQLMYDQQQQKEQKNQKDETNKSKDKQQNQEEEGEFGNIITIIKRLIQKYSILGDALIKSEKILKALSNHNVFPCFFLYKNMFLTRAVLEDEFTSDQQFSENFSNWDSFIKSVQYQELIDKFTEENNDIFLNLKHIQTIAQKKLKELDSFMEQTYIDPHLQIDMGDDFAEIYFIYLNKLYINATEKYNQQNKTIFNAEENCELLKYRAQILDCILINEGDLLDEDDEIFEIKEYQEIQVGGSNKNSKFIEKYIKRKEEIVEHLKSNYPNYQSKI